MRRPWSRGAINGKTGARDGTRRYVARRSTPGIIRFAIWLTFFNTWVLFEETVVDRYGLWEYMPVLSGRQSLFGISAPWC